MVLGLGEVCWAKTTIFPSNSRSWLDFFQQIPKEDMNRKAAGHVWDPSGPSQGFIYFCIHTRFLSWFLVFCVTTLRWSLIGGKNPDLPKIEWSLACLTLEGLRCCHRLCVMSCDLTFKSWFRREFASANAFLHVGGVGWNTLASQCSWLGRAEVSNNHPYCRKSLIYFMSVTY